MFSFVLHQSCLFGVTRINKHEALGSVNPPWFRYVHCGSVTPFILSAIDI